MKKILVPYDFSECADYALHLTVDLAKKVGCQVEILYVIESPDSQSFNTMGIAKAPHEDIIMRGEFWKAASTKLHEVADQYSDVNITAKVVEGRPFEQLYEEINDQDPDLIIMGTHGSSGLDEIFVGSNTEKVVRYAKCPVISIPSKVYIDRIDKVVFALNGAKDEIGALLAISEFRKNFDAKLFLLFVNTPHVIDSEEVKAEEIRMVAEANNIENFEVTVRKNISAEHGIMYYAEEIEADLIAMPTNSRTGLAHIFSGSLAEDIVNHAKRPVWTYSIKNK